MNTEVQPTLSTKDRFWLLGSLLLLLAGIGGFYQLSDHSLLLRVVGLLVIAGVAVWLALQSTQGGHLWSFVLDSRVELRKVVWPSRQDTLQTTMVVFIMVLIIGIFLWLVDMLLAYILKIITG
jgi:preprotein translocase subunit SecE